MDAAIRVDDRMTSGRNQEAMAPGMIMLENQALNAKVDGLNATVDGLYKLASGQEESSQTTVKSSPTRGNRSLISPPVRGAHRGIDQSQANNVGRSFSVIIYV